MVDDPLSEARGFLRRAIVWPTTTVQLDNSHWARRGDSWSKVVVFCSKTQAILDDRRIVIVWSSRSSQGLSNLGKLVMDDL